MNNTLVFIHGLESSAQGNKAQYFRGRFPDMIIEDYVGPFSERMRKLEQILTGRDHLVLVGSSYGGLMAAKFALHHEERVKKLILIAPALILEGFEQACAKKLEMPVVLYHGTRDEVVDPHETQRIALQCFAHLEHHFVDDDHPLNEVFPTLDWGALLNVS
ncbi:MAG TPA: alpha/beta fold hydrolase [Smithellaceae bacterium]|nr:alpha/beta fold hydrolase [Smithellaceae bacterium]